MKADERWLSYGITIEFLAEKAAWLSEGRDLHSGSLRFFEEAGTLISFSRYHYPLASVAFFHAIPGTERALKLHYRNEDAKLQELLDRARGEGIFDDSFFQPKPVFTKPFSRMVKE